MPLRHGTAALVFLFLLSAGCDRARRFPAVATAPPALAQPLPKDDSKLEAVLPPAEQVPGERYVHGERIRCYVLRVHKGHRGPSVTLSRTHPGLVKKLFALEVPEIAEGAVEIVALTRLLPRPVRRRVAAADPALATGN